MFALSWLYWMVSFLITCMPCDIRWWDASTSYSALSCSNFSFCKMTLLGRPSCCKRNLKISSIGKSDIYGCISRASMKRSSSAIRQVPSALSLHASIIFYVKACITLNFTSNVISESSEVLSLSSISKMCLLTCYRMESAEPAEEWLDGNLKSGTCEFGGES